MIKNNKLLAHYEQLRFILGFYIALFFTVPLLSLGLSCLAHSTEIDAGVQGAVKSALLIGLKWYAIIMPIVSVLFIIWFLCYSDTVKVTDISIKYYRWIFSKKSRSISFNEITNCVFCDGLWLHSGKYVHGRKIRIYNKKNLILELDIYYKVCFLLVLKLGEKKIQLVGENMHLKTIDNFYKITFRELSCEQQVALLKYYCKFPGSKYKTGEEILKKQKV